LLFATAIAASPSGLDARAMGGPPSARMATAMTDRRSERIGKSQRLRTSIDYAAVKRDGRALRGQHCLLLAAETPDLPTRVGFIASRKGVGGAVQRNRARRRLREIVRRLWPRVAPLGHALAFIGHRTAVTATHSELAAEVGRLLVAAGALPGDSPT
jgi:ribonuclease P protein component